MEQDSERMVLRLATDEVVDIVDAKGLSLEILSGAIWITQARDTRDIVLQPGDVFTLDRNGLAVVSALIPAAVNVIATQSKLTRVVQREATCITEQARAA